jgi:uncharacterized lipoprotein
MQHYMKVIFLMVLSFFIASCSYMYGNDGFIQNRSTDYLKAKSIPPLSIPPGLSSSSIHEEYPVSNRYYPGSDKEVNLVPPGLN